MSKVKRITISVEAPLLAQFEDYISDNGYPTRSEALKGLMRQALVEQEWKRGAEVAGMISLVYGSHKHATKERLVDVQHAFCDLVICTQHVHLNRKNCLEAIVVRGAADKIRKLVTRLKSVKGIKHSSLVMATTGKDVQ